MTNLNKDKTLHVVNPYSICNRNTDINKLSNYQYFRVTPELERNLAFESNGDVSNLFNSSRYRKIPNIDVFKLDNLTLFGHGKKGHP